jgi:hypothetical protein
MDVFEVIGHMKAAAARGEPLIFAPIDDDGDESGPPEAVYTTPDGPQLN